MTTKDLFLKEAQLRDKLISVTRADWFGQCIVFARARMSEGSVSAEEVRGANLFINALFDLPEQEIVDELHDLSLNHSLDSPRPKHDTKDNSKSKKG